MMKCSQCGVCCRLFVINLNEKEYASGKYKAISNEFKDNFKEAEMTGANLLEQNEDESCIYLKKGKCSIHSHRPESCRKFFCKSKNKKFGGMIEKINEWKKNHKSLF
jgi:Fe-S-cluster containining protein